MTVELGRVLSAAERRDLAAEGSASGRSSIPGHARDRDHRGGLTPAPQTCGSSRPAARAAVGLLGPGLQDAVLVRPDRAVPVAVVELVAVAERHALRGEERAEERRHVEDLVADQLEEPADLPLGHRAQAQPGHVDERAQVHGHHEVRPGGIREHEPGVLARDPGAEQVAVQRQRAVDLFLVPLAQLGSASAMEWGSIVAAPLNFT